ncbi:MAG: hypothetical protein N3D11_08750 [Candidatus Sumerlaeia bacterium]|nr:hypothetical protein [Candidatus Sumerlaeia bacterium]
MGKRFWPSALLACLILLWMRPISWPPNAYWQVHTQLAELHRALGVAEAWRCGLWDARWIPGFDWGYGYPIFSFYSPLFHWLSAAWLLLVGTPAAAVRLNLLAWLVLGAAGVYCAGERLWCGAGGSGTTALRPGLLCAIGWLMSPYLMCDVWVRGALSEYAAAQILPWIVWAALGILGREEHWNRRDTAEILLVAAAVAAGILSHNFLGMCGVGLALCMIPFVFVIRRFGRRRIGSKHIVLRTAFWILGIGWGLAATVFFWLPALREARFTRLSAMTGGIHGLSYRYTDHFLYPANFLRLTYWDFDNSLPGPNDTMPLHLGLVSALAVVLVMAAGAILLLRKEKRDASKTATLAALVAAIALGAWLTTASSRILWDRIALLQFAQYPWRLLPLPSLGIALVLPAALVIAAPERTRAGLLAMLGLLLICFAASQVLYGRIKGIVPYSDAFTTKDWETLQILTADLDEYGPIWRDRFRPPKWPRGVLLESDKVKVLQFESRRVSIRAEVENRSGRPEPLVLTTNYFPGWQARTEPDKRPLTVAPGPATGFILIEGVPPGRTTFRIWFGNTPLRVRCKAVSAAAWVVWLLIWSGLALRRKSDTSDQSNASDPSDQSDGATFSRRTICRRF